MWNISSCVKNVGDFLQTHWHKKLKTGLNCLTYTFVDL